ncbi:Transcription initiation factor TFIID subunit 11 [Grifola frondosa]|uniref:Transcription initiation factor TFIID subunit 11 n=1 Tax=Grifola frondosa TaxID=5627 RepID=A0A1C7M937_GRIFR|nr:Transcription initiation factor TFIID subunit 11 [Grifola frondosa]
MTSPFATYPVPERTFIPSGTPSTPAARGVTPAIRGTGAKRGRKPKAVTATNSPRAPSQTPLPGTNQSTELQWMNVQSNPSAGPSTSSAPATSAAAPPQTQQQPQTLGSESGGVISLPGIASSAGAADIVAPRPVGVSGTGVPGEEDGEGEDEVLPAMADDDYSAQLSWQSQSKDNLKVLMDNFSNAQYDRFEAYRRHALPKQAVRKVIQQTLSQQVSQPVAQIVAGFGKVFVGEIIEKARAVQERRGEAGPLSPDHLREAYRIYQDETGRVGAARPLRSKRLFVR